MAEKRNPGALAGATGAGNAFQAAAGGMFTVPQTAVSAKRTRPRDFAPWNLRDAIEARRNPDTALRLLDRETDMRAELVAQLGGAI
jgi:hypothetical protein